MLPQATAPKADAPKRDFQVPVNLSIRRDEINELLGDNIRFKQIAAASEKPLESDVETLSLADLRKFLALNLVEINDPVDPCVSSPPPVRTMP